MSQYVWCRVWTITIVIDMDAFSRTIKCQIYIVADTPAIWRPRNSFASRGSCGFHRQYIVSVLALKSLLFARHTKTAPTIKEDSKTFCQVLQPFFSSNEKAGNTRLEADSKKNTSAPWLVDMGFLKAPYCRLRHPCRYKACVAAI